MDSMTPDNCLLHEKNILLRIRGVEQHVKALMELHEANSKFQNQRLDAILEQALKTNGRVTELEKDSGGEKITVRELIIEVKEDIRDDIKILSTDVATRIGEVDTKVSKVKSSVTFWTWLTDRPYRLGAAVIAVVVLSRVVTNEMLWEFILKAF